MTAGEVIRQKGVSRGADHVKLIARRSVPSSVAKGVCPMRVLRPLPRDRVMMALQQFTRLDLRWSYIAAGVLVIVGGLLNLVLPHGWTIWPMVAAICGMMMVHEAEIGRASCRERV